MYKCGIWRGSDKVNSLCCFKDRFNNVHTYIILELQGDCFYKLVNIIDENDIKHAYASELKFLKGVYREV